MKARAKKAIRRLRKWAEKRLRKRSKEAHARWRGSCKHPSVLVWSLCVSALLMTVLPVWAFQQGLLFGVSFLLAVTFSVVEGHIFTHPARVILIAVGVSIGSTFVPELRHEGWEALVQGNMVAGFLVGGIGVYLWKIRQHLQTGTFVPERDARRRRHKSRVRTARHAKPLAEAGAATAREARRRASR